MAACSAAVLRPSAHARYSCDPTSLAEQVSGVKTLRTTIACAPSEPHVLCMEAAISDHASAPSCQRSSGVLVPYRIGEGSAGAEVKPGRSAGQSRRSGAGPHAASVATGGPVGGSRPDHHVLPSPAAAAEPRGVRLTHQALLSSSQYRLLSTRPHVNCTE